MTTIADLFTKYNCTNCQDDIQGIRVHCTECENFYLCLQCFASGAEIGAHENDHAYQFMDTGTAILSVFRGKGAWTAREEIRLLDAIEQFGFGNWEDISKHIETKSAEDAKEEYVNKFVDGTIGRHTWIPAQSQRPTLIDHTCDDTGLLGTASLQRLPPLNVSTEEAAQLGYMPNRDSFEREYDSTAEQLISGLSLNTDDIEADYLLKLAHVDFYTRRLRDRVHRKRLVRDYQLVANFFRNRNNSQYPNMPREQKESRNRFRVFAQFYTANEYERLINSLEREKDLRIRLSELYRYRYNGLTKIADCRHFEQHAVMAEQCVNLCYGLGKTLPCIISTPNCERLNGCIRQCLTTGQYALQPWKLSAGQLLFTFPANKQAHKLSNENDTNLNSIAPNSMYHTVDQISSDELLHNKNYLDSYLISSEQTTKMVAMMTTAATSALPTTVITTCNRNILTAASSNRISVLQPQLQQFLTDSIKTPIIQFYPTNDSTTKIAQSEIMKLLRRQKYSHQQFSDLYPTNIMKASTSDILKGQLDELTHLPLPLGANLLSSNEQQLCKIFNLSATTYITLKTLILSDAQLSSQNVSFIESTLRKYFIKVGWLRH